MVTGYIGTATALLLLAAAVSGVGKLLLIVMAGVCLWRMSEWARDRA